MPVAGDYPTTLLRRGPSTRPAGTAIRMPAKCDTEESVPHRRMRAAGAAEIESRGHPKVTVPKQAEPRLEPDGHQARTAAS
jgi:hypothetical protein